MPDDPTATQHGTARVVLNVRGMHCASCVNHVEAALQKVAGVRGASVNLMSEKAVVEYEPGRVSTDALSQAIASAGYQAQIETPSPPTDTQTTDQVAEMDFKVSGMHCASCVNQIEERLKKLPGMKLPP